ncbi:MULTISPECIES: nucleotide exchange factor GrpE [Bacillaceae]|uniref:Protein GrpE n=1 Tax=Gottfriedia luciferensis TaxID=178774 RepID=A0ABX2ZP08_9BACI|nr:MULTISPECIES: nucleotide exchange factor GrpE [Bacillaceae]ODG90209.1 nucleotide exchange factor GrpE [Gottfriedia luciferensis]PGZ93651.1 nucleotide exchange factor GrpE [Bacillus sp. AFS029533]SFC98862.1 molecular chaperone GrpE [Bacillus sp. UNCCL81]
MTERQEELLNEEVVNEETTVEEPSIFTEEKTDNVNSAEEELQKLRAEVDEKENKYLRLHADFENYKRRALLDQQSLMTYRAQSLVTDLLPVLDNFERALQVEATDEQTASLKQGMEMVYRLLVEAVKKEGVEEIPALGEQFDPNVHQAVMQESDDSKPSNEVLQEFQKGYKLKDRVIRPSMVKVNE